jgi:hypothetical protein
VAGNERPHSRTHLMHERKISMREFYDKMELQMGNKLVLSRNPAAQWEGA